MIDDYYEADFVITREIGRLGGLPPPKIQKKKIPKRRIGKKGKEPKLKVSG